LAEVSRRGKIQEYGQGIRVDHDFTLPMQILWLEIRFESVSTLIFGLCLSVISLILFLNGLFKFSRPLLLAATLRPSDTATELVTSVAAITENKLGTSLF
jgi:hypothetical protein